VRSWIVTGARAPVALDLARAALGNLSIVLRNNALQRIGLGSFFQIGIKPRLSEQRLDEIDIG